MIAIAVVVIVLGILAFYNYKKKGKKHEPDYYTFFIIGLIWTVFGIVFWKEMSFFFIIGLAFLAIGLVNKDKWKKNHRTLKDMNKTERKFMVWALVIGLVLFLIGLVVYFLVKNGVIV